MRYLDHGRYRINHPHLAITSIQPSVMDTRRAPTKMRLITGTYALQANRSAFNQFDNSKCLLCRSEAETRQHFLACCSALVDARLDSLRILSSCASNLDIDVHSLIPEDLTLFLINPQLFVNKKNIHHTQSLDELESLTRLVCFRLHSTRRQLLSGSSGLTTRSGI